MHSRNTAFVSGTAQKPHAPSLVMMVTGSAERESEVAKYVADMLEHIGLTDERCNLRITTRIKSSGSHNLGVQAKGVVAGKVRLHVQHGDNSTRFRCYLGIEGFKPAELFDLLRGELPGGHYDRSQNERRIKRPLSAILAFESEETLKNKALQKSALEASIVASDREAQSLEDRAKHERDNGARYRRQLAALNA